MDDAASSAETMGDAALCSPGAIHLATARDVRAGLTAFASYDERLCETARAAGLPVESPAAGNAGTS